MTKAYLHHFVTKLNRVNPWVLSFLCLVFVVCSIVGLRQNNLKMVQLRNAVAEADEQNTDVESALKNLREHVYAHMNTDLTSGNLAIYPPVQLKYRYERLVAAERERTANTNAQIYNQAQIECEKLFPAGLSGSSRIPCIQEYVAKNGTKEQSIPDALYKFDFISPKWSWDFAGWSIVGALLSFSLFILAITTKWWHKLSLSHHS